MQSPTFQPVAEGALRIEFGSEIKLEVVQQIHRLVALLDVSPLAGILEITPSFASVLVEFDALALSHEAVEAHVCFCLEQIGHIELPAQSKIEIPVFYGGSYGPDLPFCAEKLRLSVSQFVEAHCEVKFSVAFFGFLPGFAYLLGWPPKWGQPRTDSPRLKVPAGSVGIAGAQCGIYPVESPGGWRIIGQTPLKIIDRARQNFSLFSIGMEVRFYPSNPSAW